MLSQKSSEEGLIIQQHARSWSPFLLRTASTGKAQPLYSLCHPFNSFEASWIHYGPYSVYEFSTPFHLCSEEGRLR